MPPTCCKGFSEVGGDALWRLFGYIYVAPSPAAPGSGGGFAVTQPRLAWCILPWVVLALAQAVAQGGDDPNVCDAPGDSPDVVVGHLHSKDRWGNVGGITAFSLGTTSCNVGTCWLNWEDFSNHHPVIAQGMYRLKDGRFEQVGQSWVKHGFFALNQEFCSRDCTPAPTGAHLGVLCSDPYSS